jgi:hypothetical protein
MFKSMLHLKETCQWRYLEGTMDSKSADFNVLSKQILA